MSENFDVNYLKYMNFKIFSLFKDRLTNTVNLYRKEKKDDLYNHLFLAPAQYNKGQSFKVKGVTYPFVAIWPTSQYRYQDQFYSRSVLPRDFQYEDEQGNEKYLRGFLYDLQVDFEITAGSHFRDFIDQVNLDLVEFDRIRYFDISLHEIIPGLSTRIELLPKSNPLSFEFGDNRGFALSNIYTISLTYPMFNEPSIIDNLSIFLNDQKIWSQETTN